MMRVPSPRFWFVYHTAQLVDGIAAAIAWILLATVALIGLSGVAMATPMHTFTCSGEFNEGEGMAGIQIANCHIPAASPAQAKVEKVCEEGSICLVIGEGTQNHYGAIELKKIHRVVSLKTINKKTCFETGTCFSS